MEWERDKAIEKGRKQSGEEKVLQKKPFVGEISFSKNKTNIIISDQKKVIAKVVPTSTSCLLRYALKDTREIRFN